MIRGGLPLTRGEDYRYESGHVRDSHDSRLAAAGGGDPVGDPASPHAAGPAAEAQGKTRHYKRAEPDSSLMPGIVQIAL